MKAISIICYVIAFFIAFGIVGNFDYSVETGTEEQTTIWHYFFLVLFISVGFIFNTISNKRDKKSQN